jgi:hypothetical protein
VLAGAQRVWEWNDVPHRSTLGLAGVGGSSILFLGGSHVRGGSWLCEQGRVRVSPLFEPVWRATTCAHEGSGLGTGEGGGLMSCGTGI